MSSGIRETERRMFNRLNGLFGAKTQGAVKLPGTFHPPDAPKVHTIAQDRPRNLLGRIQVVPGHPSRIRSHGPERHRLNTPTLSRVGEASSLPATRVLIEELITSSRRGLKSTVRA